MPKLNSYDSLTHISKKKNHEFLPLALIRCIKIWDDNNI